LGEGVSVFERLKGITESDDSGGIEYECHSCGTRFEVQRQVCPECEGFHIDRTDW